MFAADDSSITAGAILGAIVLGSFVLGKLTAIVTSIAGVKKRQPFDMTVFEMVCATIYVATMFGILAYYAVTFIAIRWWSLVQNDTAQKVMQGAAFTVAFGAWVVRSVHRYRRPKDQRAQPVEPVDDTSTGTHPRGYL